MIIFGWGKKSKKIADIGLMRCKNCNNISGYELRELSRRASLYFISVAKWNKKYYLTCPICDAGYEIEESKKNMVLQETAMLPDNNTALNIWNDLIKFINDNFSDDKNSKENILDFIENKLAEKGYKKDDIRYVIGVFYQEMIQNKK